MARFVRDDWTRLGVTVLAEEGPAGLGVARLCERAGRTRGSLYHHFEDHDALLRAVLERWRRDSTDALAAAHPPGDGAVEALNAAALGLDFALEQNVRRLVARRADLRAFVAEVDEQRVAHLILLNRHRGANESDARMRAQIEYAAFLGFQQFELPPDRLLELFAWFDARTGPS